MHMMKLKLISGDIIGKEKFYNRSKEKNKSILYMLYNESSQNNC